MLVWVKWHAHSRNPDNAVAFKDGEQLALGCFKAGNQRFRCIISAHRFWNGIQRAGKVIGDRQNVAGKARGGIGVCILHFLFGAPPHILGLCLGIQNLLAYLFEFAHQCRQWVWFRLCFGDCFTINNVGRQFFFTHLSHQSR